MVSEDLYNSEDALKIVNTAVLREHGRHLKAVEEVVLRGSWDRLSYSAMAEASSYTESYLSQDVGPKLWQLLTQAFREVLAPGERVTKPTLRTILPRWAERERIRVASPALSLPYTFALAPNSSSTRLEQWNDLDLDVSSFGGREAELEHLRQRIVNDRLRFITLWGLFGTGKTYLAKKLAEENKSSFDAVFCRSLRRPQTPAPRASELLTELLTFLNAPHQISEISANFAEQLDQLIQRLNERRCLILLDSAEVLYEATQPEIDRHIEDYRELLRQVIGRLHQSCLIWISRERLERYPGDVEVYQLSGFSLEAGREFLQGRYRDLVGTDEDWNNLIADCCGNPAILEIVAPQIRPFGWRIRDFLAQPRGITELSGVSARLRDLFDRLSDAEQQVVCALALAQEPLPLEALQNQIEVPISRPVPEVIEALWRKALCEDTQPGQHRLHSLIAEYVRNRFLTQIKQELVNESLDLLLRYPLLRIQAHDYIQEQQRQTFIEPIAESLRQSMSADLLSQKFDRLFMQLRQQDSFKYGAGNLINLAAALDLDLSRRDFSNLPLWEADLRQVELQDANLTGCDLSRTAFAAALSGLIVLTFLGNDALVTGDREGRMMSWQISDGQLLKIYEPSVSAIGSLALSPDGRRLVGGCEDNSIRLWDVQSGQQSFSLLDHGTPVCCVCFSSDGELLASGGQNGTIRLWDMQSLTARHTLRGHQQQIHALSFSPDGSMLLSCADDRTTRLWDVSTGEQQSTPFTSSTGTFLTASYAATTAIVAEADERAIYLRSVLTRKTIKVLPGTTDYMSKAAFSPCGQHLASSSDQTVKIWNVQTGELLAALRIGSGDVFLAFSTDRALLATSCKAQVKVWETAAKRCLRTLQNQPHSIRCFALSSDGHLFCGYQGEKTIRSWEIATRRYSRRLDTRCDGVRSIAISPNGVFLASGGEDKTLHLLNQQTGATVMNRTQHTAPVRVLQFSPDGQLLASGSIDQTIKLWRVQPSGVQPPSWRRTLEAHSDSIYALSFSPDSTLLASGDAKAKICLWNVSTGQLLRSLEEHGRRVNTLSFSPDGQILASGSHDDTVRLWQVSTGNCLRTWQPETPQQVRFVMFDSAGRCIVCTVYEAVLEVYAIETDQTHLATLRGHQSPIHLIESSPDRALLISSSVDEEVRVWNWQSGTCFSVLRVDRSYEGITIRDTEIESREQRAALLNFLGASE